MSNQEKLDKITEFIAITGLAEDVARFHLDSAAWHVDLALANYYENGADNDPVCNPNPNADRPPRIDDTSGVSPFESRGVDMPSPTTGSSSSSGRSKPKPRKANTKFATLNNLAKDDDDDSEEEGQAFYAGGSEHSGQQVLGPGKRKKDIVADMFKSVQEHGVEVVERPSTSSRPNVFRGTGYKLGETASDSVTVPGDVQSQGPREITLKLWKDGFSLGEGELRLYSDPANRDFLESIKRGEIPQELRTGGNEVHLAMEDHRGDVFSSLVKKPRAFTGQGYTLGNPTPSVIGACRDEDKTVNEQAAKENLNVDSSQPVTSVQVRLADGTKLIGQFNHSHTVAEIRTYILTARPQYATQNFNLLTSYPSKVLEDSQTIQEAGILNSAIIQKIV